MDIQPAERLSKLPPYLFADLRRKMAAAREKGIRVLRIDIGDPDQATPEPVVEELRRAAADAEDPDRLQFIVFEGAGHGWDQKWNNFMVVDWFDRYLIQDEPPKPRPKRQPPIMH